MRVLLLFGYSGQRQIEHLFSYTGSCTVRIDFIRKPQCVKKLSCFLTCRLVGNLIRSADDDLARFYAYQDVFSSEPRDIGLHIQFRVGLFNSQLEWLNQLGFSGEPIFNVVSVFAAPELKETVSSFSDRSLQILHSADNGG